MAGRRDALCYFDEGNREPRGVEALLCCLAPATRSDAARGVLSLVAVCEAHYRDSFVICLLIKVPCRNSFLCRQTEENQMVRAAPTIAERLLFLIGCRPGLLCTERER